LLGEGSADQFFAALQQQAQGPSLQAQSLQMHRQGICVVDANGEVVWLCGLRVHERIRVRATTRQVRRLRWQPAP
jgi:hypothetical protein